MANPDLLHLFVRRIHDAGLPYLVVGSVGSTFYGEPRLTMDVDLAVAFSEAQVESLARIFPEAEFYVPPAETLREEVERSGGHWNIIHTATGLKADFYPCGTDVFFAGLGTIVRPPGWTTGKFSMPRRNTFSSGRCNGSLRGEERNRCGISAG